MRGGGSLTSPTILTESVQPLSPFLHVETQLVREGAAAEASVAKMRRVLHKVPRWAGRHGCCPPHRRREGSSKVLWADLGSGSAGGPDMSPFSPKLFVGSRPLWNWMASAASIAAARPQSGPQLCVLGGAEAMLREAQLS